MTARIVCRIEGCNRSMKNPRGYFEWLCRVHWKMSDPSLRADHKTARRLLKNARRRLRTRPHRDNFGDGAIGDLRQAIDAARGIGEAWEAIVNDVVIKVAFGGEDGIT